MNGQGLDHFAHVNRKCGNVDERTEADLNVATKTYQKDYLRLFHFSDRLSYSLLFQQSFGSVDSSVVFPLGLEALPHFFIDFVAAAEELQEAVLLVALVQLAYQLVASRGVQMGTEIRVHCLFHGFAFNSTFSRFDYS